MQNFLLLSKKEPCHPSCRKPRGWSLHERKARGIARPIEQINGDILALNQGTPYPLLLKLENEGSIASQWGASENHRRARFYRLTTTGRKLLQAETRDWEQAAAIIARFFEVKAEDLT